MIYCTNTNQLAFDAKLKFKNHGTVYNKQPGKYAEMMRAAAFAKTSCLVKTIGFAKLVVMIKPLIQRLIKVNNSVKFPS